MQNTKLKSLEIDYEFFGDDVLIVEEELDPIDMARLYQLSESIDWIGLEDEIVPILGSRSCSIVRLVCGTIFLKSFYELSSAEIIEKWPKHSTFRYFCGHDETLEGEAPFPIPLQILDTLESKLNGRGFDAMIRALMATSVGGDMPCETRTLH